MTEEELHAVDPKHLPTGGEFELLTGFLDYYRAVMVRKAQGLTSDQLAMRLGPSDLTLGGLIKHLAYAEDIWFDHRLVGHERGDPWARVDWAADPDWELHSAADDQPEELFALYAAACSRSRAAVAAVADLETVALLPNGRGIYFNLRWILIHMIEETARHAGHADLIRESIDGATGD